MKKFIILLCATLMFFMNSWAQDIEAEKDEPEVKKAREVQEKAQAEATEQQTPPKNKEVKTETGKEVETETGPSVQDKQEVKGQRRLIENVELSNVKIKNAEIKNSEIKNSEIKNSEIKNTEIKNAEIRNAEITNAEIKNAEVNKSDIQESPPEKELTPEPDVVPERAVQEESSSTSQSNRDAVNPTVKKKTSIGGYVAPMVRISQINDGWGAYPGIKGGFRINGFIIGGGILGYAGTLKRQVDDRERRLYMGYGGMMMEYNFFRKKFVNFSIGAIVGAGTVGYIVKIDNTCESCYDEDYDDDSDEEYEYRGHEFFVVEPELTLYIKVTSFFRIGASGSYRFVYGLNHYGLDDETFTGFSGSLILQFGWF